MEHQPQIRRIPKIRLAGLRASMSFSRNTTPELWQRFSPLRKEVEGTVGSELFSAEVYPQNFFRSFDSATLFEKWAAVQVNPGALVPEGMEVLEVPEGEYAVFVFKGKADNAAAFYSYIFTDWLPASAYSLDDRPHLAVMGEKYRHNHEDSEEEIMIPVRRR